MPEGEALAAPSDILSADVGLLGFALRGGFFRERRWIWALIMRTSAYCLMAMLLCLVACAPPPPRPSTLPPEASALESPTFTQLGIASWYGKDHDGKLTANGEHFDMHAMTAAHRTLAFDTIVRVTNTTTGQMVKVRINDRGPYTKRRVIDLSSAAAAALRVDDDGVALVRVEVFAADQRQN